MTTNDPSCLYYEHLPCDEPAKCPVHGPLLKRPTKKRHYLRVGLEAFSWDKDGHRPWRRTLCGIYLHRRLNYEVVFNDEGKDSSFEQWFQRREELEQSGWKRMPIPSTDPKYEVFYEVGWGRREILVATATGEPTCRRCIRIEKVGLLTIEHPSTTFDAVT